jgi:hypothetical protein
VESREGKRNETRRNEVAAILARLRRAYEGRRQMTAPACPCAGNAQMETCLDQYKAGNGNGGLKWIQKGGDYYSQCNSKLKGA